MSLESRLQENIARYRQLKADRERLIEDAANGAELLPETLIALDRELDAARTIHGTLKAAIERRDTLDHERTEVARQAAEKHYLDDLQPKIARTKKAGAKFFNHFDKMMAALSEFDSSQADVVDYLQTLPYRKGGGRFEAVDLGRYCLELIQYREHPGRGHTVLAHPAVTHQSEFTYSNPRPEARARWATTHQWKFWQPGPAEIVDTALDAAGYEAACRIHAGFELAEQDAPLKPAGVEQLEQVNGDHPERQARDERKARASAPRETSPGPTQPLKVNYFRQPGESTALGTTIVVF